MPVADETLMTRAGHGDADAFTEIVRRYEAKARRYCYRIFRDTQFAEDVAQEVFLKLYRTADRYEPTGRFSTFFYRVLGNLCFDKLRFRKRRAAVRGPTLDGPALDALPDEDGKFRSPEEAVLLGEEKEAVRAAVAELPESLQRAIALREFEGLKYREIAEVMAVSLNEVKVLIHRGRKQLAKRLSRVLATEREP